MDNVMLYRDRHDAGMHLANRLLRYQHDPETMVLAIPRGGVPVAYEVAKKLQLPLDIFLIRKLGVPSQKELAMGAIASGGVVFFNDDVIANLSISKEAIHAVIAEEKTELKRREVLYRQGRTFLDVRGKKIILIDDGIATGASMYSAIIALKKLLPKEIVIAVPVAPETAIRELSFLVDKVECLYPASVFFGVGDFYADFSQIEDEEVISLLNTR